MVIFYSKRITRFRQTSMLESPALTDHLKLIKTGRLKTESVWTGRVAQMVACLLSNGEALNSNSRTAKQTNKTKKPLSLLPMSADLFLSSYTVNVVIYLRCSLKFQRVTRFSFPLWTLNSNSFSL
jgi:hypothetical protein